MLCSTTSTSGLSASIAIFAECGLRHPDPVGVVDHLALEVRLVDDVVVDDAERAHAGRGQVQRGRRAEPAGAEQQHLRVEQLELALDPDLGEQGVARVAHPLVAGQAGGVDGGSPASSQATIPPSTDGDVVVAERGELGGHLRGAVVGAAVQDEALGRVGGDLVEALDQLALRHVHGARRCGTRPTRSARGRRSACAVRDLLARGLKVKHLDRHPENS